MSRTRVDNLNLKGCRGGEGPINNSIAPEHPLNVALLELKKITRALQLPPLSRPTGLLLLADWSE